MRRQPAPPSLQSDDFEFERPRLALKDAAMQIHERGAMFGSGHLDELKAPHRVNAVRFDHREAGGIHVDEPPLPVDQFDALRLGLDDGPQPRLTLAQRGFGPSPVPDVERESHHAGDLAAAPHERLDTGAERAAAEPRLLWGGLAPQGGVMRGDHSL